eukprot:g19441.t1
MRTSLPLFRLLWFLTTQTVCSPSVKPHSARASAPDHDRHAAPEKVAGDDDEENKLPLNDTGLRRLFPDIENINGATLSATFHGQMLLQAIAFLRDFIDLERFFSQVRSAKRNYAAATWNVPASTTSVDNDGASDLDVESVVEGNDQEAPLNLDSSSATQAQAQQLPIWFVVISRAQLCLLNNYLSWLAFGPLVGYFPLEKPLVQFVITLDKPSYQYCESLRLELGNYGNTAVILGSREVTVHCAKIQIHFVRFSRPSWV